MMLGAGDTVLTWGQAPPWGSSEIAEPLVLTNFRACTPYHFCLEEHITRVPLNQYGMLFLHF